MPIFPAGGEAGVRPAAVDNRIGRVAVADYFRSFASQMIAMKSPASGQFANSWNDAQLDGRLKSGEYQVDLGSVIPSVLKHGDVADIAALVAPRRVLFCMARDNGAPAVEALSARFHHLVESPDGGWMQYEPGKPLDANLLLKWLKKPARQ